MITDVLATVLAHITLNKATPSLHIVTLSVTGLSIAIELYIIHDTQQPRSPTATEQARAAAKPSLLVLSDYISRYATDAGISGS